MAYYNPYFTLLLILYYFYFLYPVFFFIQNQKKEYAQKEIQLQTNRKYLIESLTKAHETIDKYKKEIDFLKSENNRYVLLSFHVV